MDFRDVPCPKREQFNEVSVQFEGTELVPTLETFQNGEHSDNQRSHPGRRLDGKNGSEGCLLCIANQVAGSKMVEVPKGRGDLQIYISPIWPISCSKSVYQSSQTGCFLDETVWVSKAQVQPKLMVLLFEVLGFSINYKKSVLDPQLSMEFLGFQIDSRSMTVALPAEKLGKLHTQARNQLAQTFITGRELIPFIGRANLATLAIPPTPLFYLALQGAKHATFTQYQGLDSAISVMSQEREELLWWVKQERSWNRSSLKPPSRFLKIQMDSSKLGWG